MNDIKFTPANLEQIRPALEHRGWHLVDARDDWFQNGKKMRTRYVLDEHGDVMGHYFDLVTLARDLRVLSEGETVECCYLQLAEVGGAMEALDLADGHTAEVTALTAAIGNGNPISEGRVLAGDAHDLENKRLRVELAAANKRINGLEQQWKRLTSW